MNLNSKPPGRGRHRQQKLGKVKRGAGGLGKRVKKRKKGSRREKATQKKGITRGFAPGEDSWDNTGVVLLHGVHYTIRGGYWVGEPGNCSRKGPGTFVNREQGRAVKAENEWGVG